MESVSGEEFQRGMGKVSVKSWFLTGNRTIRSFNKRVVLGTSVQETYSFDLSMFDGSSGDLEEIKDPKCG